MHGRQLAKQLGLFHISFRDRLQELIIAKTKKKIGPEFEDEEDEPAITPPEGQEFSGKDKNWLVVATKQNWNTRVRQH